MAIIIFLFWGLFILTESYLTFLLHSNKAQPARPTTRWLINRLGLWPAIGIEATVFCAAGAAAIWAGGQIGMVGVTAATLVIAIWNHVSRTKGGA